MVSSLPSLNIASSSKASKSSYASLLLSYLEGNPSMAFLGVSFSSCSKNFKSNSAVGSQTFSIDQVTIFSFVALDLASSLALADLKVVNLSDYGFASPKMKRRRPLCSRNRMGQKKKVQEEEKPHTITPPPAAPPSPSLKSKEQSPTMAEPENPGVLDQTLKPFYQRASEAEDRLTRLEAALASKQDSGNKDHSKLNSELQEKIKKLAAENAKLQYRIHHLVQAVRDADVKLEKKPLNQSRREEKVIGDAAGVRSGGGAPLSEPSGGELRDILTLRVVRTKTGIQRTCREGKVIGDAAGVRLDGGAPSLAPDGGEQRDVRTLRTRCLLPVRSVISINKAQPLVAASLG
ncbi:hypothetical protein ACLB2K_066226 [Fragaria x ananassa]